MEADRVTDNRRHHCVISGTGRTGTSFLVQLLTHLGIDTGHTIEDLALHEFARAGLEKDIRSPDAPYIVKSPWFCDYAEEVFARDDIVVDRLFIPMRDVFAAAESRRYVVREHALTLPYKDQQTLEGSTVDGGLWHTNDPAEQESILIGQLYNLLLAAAATDTPITLLRYPLLARNPEYLFRKLSAVLTGITLDHFLAVFDNVVRPDWIHQFGEGDML